MDRKDKFGRELLPKEETFNRIIDALKPVYHIVQIGSGKPLYHLEGIDLDLTSKTSITDLLDIALIADRFMGQVSFIIPLSESFDKKALIVWASKGLNSQERYISRITPRKILHKPSSLYVMDDWPDEKIERVLMEFIH